MEIKDCIILMGGMGTRCYPFSYILPKCMVPILNKPVIEYVVEDAIKGGFENIFFVLPKYLNSKVCIDHFKQNKKILKFLKQKNSPYYEIIKNRKFPKITPVYVNPNGTGGAVLACKKYLKNKTFAVVNGDDVFVGNPSSLSQLKQFALLQNACVMACTQVNMQESKKYGMIDFCLENGQKKVINIIEKSQNNENLIYANIGRYILDYKIFDYIKKLPKVNGELLLTDAISNFAKDNKMFCTTLKSKRFDCGTLEGIIDANNQLFYGDKQY